MRPITKYRRQPPEFWATVKLASQLIGYSTRKTKKAPSRVRVYTPEEVEAALRGRGLRPSKHTKLIELVANYSRARAELLHDSAEPNLMNRAQARTAFNQLVREVKPPQHLISKNKQKGGKKHPAFLASMVNVLTWRELMKRFGTAEFDPNPRGPLTFSRKGMPLRTLFRWMDGAYPSLNRPRATWEVKEYYGTKTFGSRVADGVYETALDGYELEDLRSERIRVEHYLFLDDRFTWWDCGKSYLCRIVDMLHVGLLDGAFVGREVLSEWPGVVDSWKPPPGSTS